LILKNERPLRRGIEPELGGRNLAVSDRRQELLNQSDDEPHTFESGVGRLSKYLI
jgi:hypothetical protein